MEFLFNLINEDGPKISTEMQRTNNRDVEVASLTITDCTEEVEKRTSKNSNDTKEMVEQQTEPSKSRIPIVENISKNRPHGADEIPVADVQNPTKLKDQTISTTDTATFNVKSDIRNVSNDVPFVTLHDDCSGSVDFTLDPEDKLESVSNENLNPRIPSNAPFFGLCAAAIAYKLEDDLEFQKRFPSEMQPVSFSYNNLPESIKKRHTGFRTPSPKKCIVEDEVVVRKSPQLVISSDSSSVSTICQPDDLHLDDLPFGSILETRSQTNFIKPSKRIFKKWIPVIPTIRDKFIKLIAPLVEINKSSNSVVCYACNATVPFNQKAIFPHIRNCVNIHCFRKWMFNFDAVKYQISYAKDESWQSRWNNTKILVKNLEFKGLHGYLLQYFKKVNMDYECHGCMHMCCTLDEEDPSLVYLKLLSHMLSCNYSIFDLYSIMEELYNLSLHSPILKKIKIKAPRLIAQPMYNNCLDGGKGQEQRIEMLKLQIINKKLDLEMYKEYNKLKNEQIELETTKIQEEIKLNIITYLSMNGNNKTLAKVIKRFSEE